MKVRNGFVSNSSSSSFIVCGFSADNSCEAYNMLKEKFRKENPDISEKELYWKVYAYLQSCGIDYCHREEWNDTEDIGCILEEGSRERFDESLKKAEDILEKFDKEYHTDFARDYRIYSVFEEDY